MFFLYVSNKSVWFIGILFLQFVAIALSSPIQNTSWLLCDNRRVKNIKNEQICYSHFAVDIWTLEFSIDSPGEIWEINNQRWGEGPMPLANGLMATRYQKRVFPFHSIPFKSQSIGNKIEINLPQRHKCFGSCLPTHRPLVWHKLNLQQKYGKKEKYWQEKKMLAKKC